MSLCYVLCAMCCVLCANVAFGACIFPVCSCYKVCKYIYFLCCYHQNVAVSESDIIIINYAAPTGPIVV
jgi:hypothetical protein